MSWIEDMNMDICPPDEYWGDSCENNIDDLWVDDSIFKEYIMGNLYWTTKSGEKILVQDLKESHIKNILKVNFPNKENWDLVLNFELKRRKNGC